MATAGNKKGTSKKKARAGKRESVVDKVVSQDGGRSPEFSELEGALMAAAKEFSSDAQPLGDLLARMVADVDRAASEPLEIFPVAHHSPASAIHMVQRLRARKPRVIFIELCEDLQESIEGLSDSTLPVALQAFSGEAEGFPGEWAPLSVIAPLTELSAEYQAIAYASQHEDVALLFVDRSVDHVYQAIPQTEEGLQDAMPDSDEGADDEEAADLHGSAIGVELGRIIPSFGDFLDFLLANARVNHFAEWWSLYVEQPTIGASYETYRRVLFLVGSLIRRLGSTKSAIDKDEMRERYMWTRMKDYLRAHKIAPEDALYICGAAHTASDVAEFGTGDDLTWAIPERTKTEWLYGLIPSSYSSIEYQFSHPRGTISLASETWKKAVSALNLKPFSLAKKKKKKKASTKKKKTASKKTGKQSGAGAEEAVLDTAEFLSMLTRPPALVEQDQEQLLTWCTGVVQLARKNGYLASTADSIAIYHNALLLASLRSRRHPSPGDFTDAAVTCLEKNQVPGKRSITRLCEILLGADKVGQVGYSSLPPLVKDVLDRLAPTGVIPKKTTITRWLVDFRKNPELKPCSDLLWRLHYLLPGSKVARPIMGERKLGGKVFQESWDIKPGGPEQRHLIELAYRGVTVEQVLENRLRVQAMANRATTLSALESVEASILFLDSPRLTHDLGERAVHLLTGGLGADDAQEISDRTRRLVHYFRATPTGMPKWLNDLVATGYQHYSTMLPEGFSDRGTEPAKVAGMLSFVFGFESLALTLGCDRSQLVIAIQQAGGVTGDPEKLGLLWAAEWLVALKDEHDVRESFDEVLANPMSRAGYPNYLSGFLLALGFSPLPAQLGVELLGKAFSDLPDSVLMPWLPGLIDSLRPRAGDIMPVLLKEAKLMLPTSLAETDRWEPPWEGVERAPASTVAAAAPALELSPEEAGARELLFGQRATADGLAAAYGLPATWVESRPGTAGGPSAGAASAGGPALELSPEEADARALLFAHRTTTDQLAALVGSDGAWTESTGGGPSTAPATALAGGPSSAPGASASADSPEEAGARELLDGHGGSLTALSQFLSRS